MHTAPIYLEAGLKASLDWASEKEAAKQAITLQKKVLWILDFGLFENLIYPFSHQSQFLSFALSIDHFKTDIWAHFKEDSLGVVIYQGSADYSFSLPFDDHQEANMREWMKLMLLTPQALSTEASIEISSFDDVTRSILEQTEDGLRLISLFCRDASIGYLNLLAANIPDEIPTFAELDGSQIKDPGLLSQLTTREKYERIIPLCPDQKESQEAKVAICIPPGQFVSKKVTLDLSRAIEGFMESSIEYKMIPETHLVSEWDELDTIVACSKGVSSEGLRKLKGFCAAGGTVAVIGPALSLDNEIPFDEWLAANKTL